MTHDLLETGIISNVVKPQPSEARVAWMSTRHDEDLFIASLTVAEIRCGILETPRAGIPFQDARPRRGAL